MASLQELVSLGEQMDLTGEALQKFVTDQQNLARDERNKQRDFERELKDKEMKVKELELQIERQKAGGLSQPDLDFYHEHDDDDDSVDQTPGRSHTRGPKMSAFDELKDDIDSYLNRFERYAELQKWHRKSWSIYLAALLRGKALDVYARLPPPQAQNYDDLKDALLRRYNKTEEGYRDKFYSSKADVNESPQQFLVRLSSYLFRWIDLSGVEPSYPGLCDLIIREQYLKTCSRELELFLRERAITNLEELAKLAQQFMDAHRSGREKWREDNVPPQEVARRSSPPQQTKRCYACNRVGHVARNCRMNKVAGLQTFEGRGNFNRGNQGGWNKQVSSGPYNSNRCGGYQASGRPPQSYAANAGNENSPAAIFKCLAHNRDNCKDCATKCLASSEHQCNALLSTSVTLDCGCKLPVVADACNLVSRQKNLPVTKGVVDERPVEVLRDTGCSTVVIRRSLVRPGCYTGKTISCVLIDGTVRKVPEAEIQVETNYFAGTVKALCMNNPLYDLIIGNIPGVRDDAISTSTEAVQGVITRAMAQKQRQPQKPLTVLEPFGLDVNGETFGEMQRDDNSLNKVRDKVIEDQTNFDPEKERECFIMKRGVLYRRSVNNMGQEFTQLIVPTELREKVMSLAHDSVMGGHQGINRTGERVQGNFWWPGLVADIARYCKSCDVCQRTLAKGRIPRVPLGSMPLIETPFERVAVDLIGPITPVTEEGHRYILTLIDYATRYPEAVALKGIQTETVAEALVEMFSRLGVPKEILSDQGSQFVSSTMKEVSRLLSMRQLITTPYHPMCNGLVERFNGTLKTMLKRMCTERPKDWNRYISPLLFAYREVKQESLGFSPFELLYGRTVRGPMAILRELWSKDDVSAEVKTTYQYVFDLQNRIEQTCELAREQLSKAHDRQKHLYDKKTVSRKLKAGSKVLVLRPTSNNKLLMQWHGPFEVICETRCNNYKIQVGNKTRTYHTNMLKEYITRNEVELLPASEENNEHGDDAVEVAEAAVIEAEDDSEGDVQLFQSRQHETIDDVDINPDLEQEKQQQIRALLEQFKDIFTDVPGVTDLIEHEINLTTNEPVRSRLYPIPYALREELSKEIDDMLSLGIIEPSTSSYASPVVMVKKSDGSYRVCSDFRKLNRITVFDAEPIPTAADIFSKLSECQYFSKFDLCKGYWQIKIKEEDKEFTSFTCHKGLFQYNVMPFGLVNAPATFNRMMRRLLQNEQTLSSYFDDVLSHTGSWDTHMTSLREFFTRIRNAHLTLKPSKCSLGYDNISFLGYELGKGCLKPLSSTVDKIMRAPRPTTKTQLRSFLGLIGYYRSFVPNFALLALPLTDLTKKGLPNVLEWTDAQERAFNSLRQYLVNPPILRLPDYKKQFILQTDAASEGIGAILLQEEEGCRYPVAFASRKLLPRECNYATIEKECLAVVWGVQKFQTYLYGSQFILETDHQPLQYLQQNNFQNSRLTRWSLSLQPYRFTLRYIKGCLNVGADFLSRNYAMDP
jgi:hypothetical protein